MVVVDADFDNKRAFLMKQDDFIFRSTASRLFQFRLKVLYKDLDLLRVDRYDVVVCLEMRGEFFEGYGAAVRCDRAGHGVVFAIFLVLCSRQCC